MALKTYCVRPHPSKECVREFQHNGQTFLQFQEVKLDEKFALPNLLGFVLDDVENIPEDSPLFAFYKEKEIAALKAAAKPEVKPESKKP